MRRGGFSIDDSGQQNAGIRHDRPAGFDREAAAEIADRLADQRGVIFERRRGFVLVGDADAAAEIDRIDRQSRRAQALNQRRDLAVGRTERIEFDQLRPDMGGDAYGLEPRQASGLLICGDSMVVRDAELVAALARRDFIMRMGIDIGVDSKRDALGPP